MEIIFSRHSKRRMKLYAIDEQDVAEIIGSQSIVETQSSKGIIFYPRFNNKYKYSLKIVYSIEIEKIIVVTVYPLKKGTI